MRVIWLPRAEANLLHIVEYIAADNVDAALALAKLIRARAEQLGQPPTLFRKGRVRGTREMLVHPNYVVVNRVRARIKRIEILRVLTRRQVIRCVEGCAYHGRTPFPRRLPRLGTAHPLRLQSMRSTAGALKHTTRPDVPAGHRAPTETIKARRR